jgi:hypothetical protein
MKMPSETQRMIEEENRRRVTAHVDAARAVVTEQPAWSVSRQLAEVMRRTKGGANPVWVRSVLEKLRAGEDYPDLRSTSATEKK